MRHHLHICFLAVLLGAGFELRADPVPVKNVVFKPTFVTAEKPVTAGTAFLCEYPERTNVILITAHHLLGRAGGFPSEVAWDRVNEIIKSATAISMDDPDIRVTSKRAVLIEGAHALDKTGLQNDVAVFELDYTNPLHALKLARSAPVVGDRVWLYGRQRGSQVLELFPATVTQSRPEQLRFVFDANGIRLAGTSGAPVLNSAGDVVAINIGGEEHAGKQVGYGNPMPSIRDHLHDALKDKAINP